MRWVVVNIRSDEALRSATSAGWCFQTDWTSVQCAEVNAGNGSDSMRCLPGKDKRRPFEAAGDTQTAFVRVKAFLQEFHGEAADSLFQTR